MLTYQVLDSVNCEKVMLEDDWKLQTTRTSFTFIPPLVLVPGFWIKEFPKIFIVASDSFQLLACRWTLNVWLTRPSLIWNIPQNTTPNSYMIKNPRELMKSNGSSTVAMMIRILLFKNIIIQLSSSDIAWPQTPWGRCLVNAPELHPTPM